MSDDNTAVLGFSGCSLTLSSSYLLLLLLLPLLLLLLLLLLLILEFYVFRSSSSFYQGESVIDVDLFPQWVSASTGRGYENGPWLMILHAKWLPERSLAGEPCPDMRRGSNFGVEGSCESLTSSSLFVLVSFLAPVIMASNYHCPTLSRPQYCCFLLSSALVAKAAHHELLSLLAFLVPFLVP